MLVTRNMSSGGAEPKKRRISSRYSGRDLLLEDDQINLIVDSYAKISDKYYALEQMFLQLFVRDDPEIALVFGLNDIPDEELRRRTPFRTHVCKFLRFITTVVDLLPKKDREEELIQIIRMVGRQHCNVKTLSFNAARWLSFKNAMLNTFAKNEKDKTYQPWSILIGFIIYEIKDAYLAHIRTSRSNSLPHVLEVYKLEFRKATAESVSLANQMAVATSVTVAHPMAVASVSVPHVQPGRCAALKNF
uniref:Globin family profile domain-containing protein n=1 Tax=Acrobeloides nanus TaxID=290746 RepID=A0A914C2G5_9BILA